MKSKFLYALFLCVLITILSCSSTNIYAPQISNIPATEEGTIYIRSSGMGSSKQAAYNDAISHAFKTLCFQGIPESVQSRPLIEDEAKARSENPSLFTCIETKECYQQFATSITEVGNTSNVKGGVSILTDIKINLRAFRAYLEKGNVIRKFGF